MLPIHYNYSSCTKFLTRSHTTTRVGFPERSEILHHNVHSFFDQGLYNKYIFGTLW